MKTEKEIRKALYNVDSGDNKYPGMTYEQGIDAALMWVLGDIPDNEFEYVDK